MRSAGRAFRERRQGLSDAGESEHVSKATTRRVGAGFSWLKPLARFLAWWFSFFALLGHLSTCPVCGQPGCAGGVAGAGIFGGVAAALLWIPRQIIRSFRARPRTDEGSAE